MDNNLLTNEQLERLCTLVYLEDMYSWHDKGTLGEITEHIAVNGLRGQLPCLMTKPEWTNVLNGLRDDVVLCSLTVIKTINVLEKEADGTLPGHRAFAFMDNDGNAYAVFRGTGSDEEWLDNGQGMLVIETPQQKAAARFVTELAQDARVKKIITAGHSKGGNKAHYAAIIAPEGMVSYALSFDGQGFSPECILRYQSEIKKRKDILHLIAERRDFVHALGLYVNGPGEHYSGRRGGEPIYYFHCPDALRDENGKVGPFSAAAPIPAMVNTLVINILQNPRYKKNKPRLIMGLVGLMTVHEHHEIIKTTELVAELIHIIWELCNENDTFRKQVADVIEQEPDALKDTYEAIKETSPYNEIFKYIKTNKNEHLECIAHLLICIFVFKQKG